MGKNGQQKAIQMKTVKQILFNLSQTKNYPDDLQKLRMNTKCNYTMKKILTTNTVTSHSLLQNV